MEPPSYECLRSGGRLLEAYLLLLIAEKPAHGYELNARLSSALPPAALPDEATVYRNLRRMEAHGLVDSKWDTTGSGPPRRFYDITADGLAALTAFAGDISATRDLLDRFLTRFKRYGADTGRQNRSEEED